MYLNNSLDDSQVKLGSHTGQCLLNKENGLGSCKNADSDSAVLGWSPSLGFGRQCLVMLAVAGMLGLGIQNLGTCKTCGFSDPTLGPLNHILHLKDS